MWPSDGSSPIIKHSGLYTNDDTGYVYCLNAGTWKYVALYEGKYTIDNLPEYQPKGYETELFICNQYDINDNYIGLRKFGQAINLLDNSDFTNLVNQRGITNTTMWEYCIDRWIARTSDMTLSANNDGLKISSSATRDKFIYQTIANSDKLVNKTLTLAVCDSYNNISINVVDTPSTISTEWITLKSISTDDILIMFFSNHGKFNFAVSPSNDIRVKWVALYEGEYTLDTLPEYQPKGYTAELIECQRYYLPLNTACLMGYATQTSAIAYLTVPIPVLMQAVPELKWSGANSPRIRAVNGAFTADLNQFEVYNMVGNSVCIKFPTTEVSTGPLAVFADGTTMWL